MNYFTRDVVTPDEVMYGISRIVLIPHKQKANPKIKRTLTNVIDCQGLNI
jgi:hypothetical protein